MSEWQPIETAPKDGAHFIAWVEWRDKPTWNECWWSDANKAWLVDAGHRDIRQPKVPIRFWQPSPTAPHEAAP